LVIARESRRKQLAKHSRKKKKDAIVGQKQKKRCRSTTSTFTMGGVFKRGNGDFLSPMKREGEKKPYTKKKKKTRKCVYVFFKKEKKNIEGEGNHHHTHAKKKERRRKKLGGPRTVRQRGIMKPEKKQAVKN